MRDVILTDSAHPEMVDGCRVLVERGRALTRRFNIWRQPVGSSIAVLVRTHRGRAGLTQLRLAQEAGISVRAVRDIEAGRVTQPRRTWLRRLAAALDLT